MLQAISHQGLSRCALHAHYHSHLLRFSSIAVKDKAGHNIFSSVTTPGKSVVKKVPSTYSDGKGRDGGWNYRSRWYSKPLGKLVGAIGAVATMGLGTVLSESQEEGRVCESEAADTILKTYGKNEETQVGKDVVGTERKNEDEKVIISPNTRLCVDEAGDLQGVKTAEKQSKHEERVLKARQILKRFAEEVGAPGLVIAVTVNGKPVWTEGYGYADLENGVRCRPATVMRIASISKTITMAAVAKLWEENKLDLDAPIQKYIKNYPKKTYNGEEVTITTRQLVTHKSGIRHYKVKESQAEKNNNKGNQSNEEDKNQSEEKRNKTSKKKTKDLSCRSKPDVEEVKTITSSSESEEPSNKDIKEEENKDEEKTCSFCKNFRRRRKTKDNKDEYEFDFEEYYIKDKYETIEDAMKLFQDDDLMFKPDEGFLYTTHGWTVVSAVVEGAAQKPFTQVIKRLFFDLGLHNTYLDMPSPIIYNRASYYIRDKHGRLKNAPYVDNSYKWAGGGFLSTVGDLCRFGNAMLYASQQEYGGDTAKLPGYLKSSTLSQMWTPVEGSGLGFVDACYGMGWFALEDKQSCQFCHDSRFHAYHTGGAVGASSVLVLLPQRVPSNVIPPQGVVVAIMTNMQGVNCYKVGLQIAELFEENT